MSFPDMPVPVDKQPTSNCGASADAKFVWWAAAIGVGIGATAGWCIAYGNAQCEPRTIEHYVGLISGLGLVGLLAGARGLAKFLAQLVATISHLSREVIRPIVLILVMMIIAIFAGAAMFFLTEVFTADRFQFSVDAVGANGQVTSEFSISGTSMLDPAWPYVSIRGDFKGGLRYAPIGFVPTEPSLEKWSCCSPIAGTWRSEVIHLTSAIGKPTTLQVALARSDDPNPTSFCRSRTLTVTLAPPGATEPVHEGSIAK